MTARRPILRLRHDDAGVFPVVEAILVAVLVMTAIIFFTSVQRPTTAAEEGGIDLGQVAADTLQLMQSSVQGTETFEGWATNLTQGESATAATVHEYLVGASGDGVLPKGVRYQLRLDNGVSSIPLLPPGGAEAPRGARAADVTVMPNWATYRNERADWVMAPGEVFAAGDPRLPLVDTSTTYRCLRDPTGSRTLVDLGDSGAVADNWIDSASPLAAGSHWKATPPVDGALTSPVLWKSKQNQVPLDVPLGTWAAYTSTDCSDGAPVYFQVVPPGNGARRVTDAVTTGVTLTSATAGFTSADIGRLVGSANVPAGTRIVTVNSATSVTLTTGNTTTAGTAPATFGLVSPFMPYTLQLVVWFGA